MERLVDGTFMSTGQVCMAVKRLYVPRRRVGDFVEGLGAILGDYVIGNGLDPGTTLGPVHTRAQRDRVDALVEDARQRGGTVHELGELREDPAHGYFLRPMLVTDLTNEAALVQEEQFGPVLPIIGYDSVDEAVAMANDSQYGLASSVWSVDEERARSVAQARSRGDVPQLARCHVGGPEGPVRRGEAQRTGPHERSLGHRIVHRTAHGQHPKLGGTGVDFLTIELVQ